MWQNVIIAKRRDDGYCECLSRVFGSTKDLFKLLYDPSVGLEHLVRISRDVLIAIMSCGVARPDDEINIVLDIILYPLEGFIYEAKW